MATAQLETTKADINTVLGVLGFYEASTDGLDNNNISDISCLITTRRQTHDALTNAHRVAFAATDAEQIKHSWHG